MRTIRNAVILALAAMLCLFAAAGAETVSGFAVEANTEFKPELYPYVVHGETADWYLSQADIDAMGLDAMISGLEQVLVYQEQDFTDARDLLAPYMNDVPTIMICTDFSGHAEKSESASAYYNGLSGFIKVFRNWRMCRASLLHEYVHYLTLTCAKSPVRAWFWAEGIAEYVSRFACKNRMSRSVNRGTDKEWQDFYREKGAWDPEEDCIDEKLLSIGIAELYRRGDGVGQRYNAVNNKVEERTEKIQQDPKPELLSYEEAASMVAYLAERFGEDFVFSHWDGDPEKMEEDWGADFRQLYQDWAAWNTQQCALYGLVMDQ